MPSGGRFPTAGNQTTYGRIYSHLSDSAGDLPFISASSRIPRKANTTESGLSSCVPGIHRRGSPRYHATIAMTRVKTPPAQQPAMCTTAVRRIIGTLMQYVRSAGRLGRILRPQGSFGFVVRSLIRDFQVSIAALATLT